MDGGGANRERDEAEQPRDGVSEEELEAERGGELPDREALSVVNADVAIPVDPSVAADVLEGADPPEEEPQEGDPEEPDAE